MVGVGAYVAVAADSGGYGPECDEAVAVDVAGEVADAAGCGRPGKVGGWVNAGRITGNGVRYAEIEAGLKGVGEVPGVGCGVEDPLLQASCCLCSGVRVEVCATGVAIALIGNVEGVGVGEPEAEGSSYWISVLCQRRRKASQDADVVGQASGL